MTTQRWWLLWAAKKLVPCPHLRSRAMWRSAERTAQLPSGVDTQKYNWFVWKNWMCHFSDTTWWKSVHIPYGADISWCSYNGLLMRKDNALGVGLVTVTLVRGLLVWKKTWRGTDQDCNLKLCFNNGKLSRLRHVECASSGGGRARGEIESSQKDERHEPNVRVAFLSHVCNHMCFIPAERPVITWQSHKEIRKQV